MSAKILMYGNQSCPYCGAARMLLKKKGLDFEDISISGKPELRREMEARSGRTSVPQIFVGDTHVGGFDDLYALNESGDFDALLEKAQLGNSKDD